jgi:hypothetical protein
LFAITFLIKVSSSVKQKGPGVNSFDYLKSSFTINREMVAITKCRSLLLFVLLSPTFTAAFSTTSSSLRATSIYTSVRVKHHNVNLQMRSKDSSSSALHAFFDGKSNTESATMSIGNINKLFVRCSWISW